MVKKSKVYVIGIGYKPLSIKASEVIRTSQVILASKRLFEVFKEYKEFEAVKERIRVINNVDETIEFIKSRISDSKSNIILLASGDPLFFGIGRRVIKEFGKETIEIIPDLSSIQMAFSRLKEPWDDAFLMSLHGGPDPEKRRRLPYEIHDIPALLIKHKKIAILTDRENNPSEIARVLRQSPVAHSLSPVMSVCERLGYHDERITEGSLEDIAEMRFSEPNVVVIQRTEDITHKTDILFGLNEDEFVHSRGLITKDEVRAVVIHKLRLPQRGVFWDIGAGSGSISIEVARLCPGLRVYAIERDSEQLRNIRENKVRFEANNLEIIKGMAPDILSEIPEPDRVFVGGSGGRLREIIDVIDTRIGSGIIVITATTLETLNDSFSLFKERDYRVDVVEINVAGLKPLGSGHHLYSKNPVFIITGSRDRDV